MRHRISQETPPQVTSCQSGQVVSCHDLGTSEHYLNQRCPLFIISKKILKSGGVVADQYYLGTFILVEVGGKGEREWGTGFLDWPKEEYTFFSANLRSVMHFYCSNTISLLVRQGSTQQAIAFD